MIERAKERNERILTEPLPTRNTCELQWDCRDIEAMPRREKFKQVVNHLKNGISAKKLRNELLMEASTETRRERKIPLYKPQALPAI